MGSEVRSPFRATSASPFPLSKWEDQSPSCCDDLQDLAPKRSEVMVASWISALQSNQSKQGLQTPAAIRALLFTVSHWYSFFLLRCFRSVDMLAA